MDGIIKSVNIGLPKTMKWQGKDITTSIFKTPVSGPVRIIGHNMEGDRQADTKVHGGRYKAVYGYPIEHYTFWEKKLGCAPLIDGSFGENLTTEGLDEHRVFVGNVYEIGSALLQVSQARTPCYKLNVKFGIDHMQDLFIKAQKPGFYFSVIREGSMEKGSTIRLVEEDTNQVNVVDAFRLYVGLSTDRHLLEKTIKVAGLSEKWREKFLMKLNKL